MEKYELKILNDDFENRTKYKITSDQIITLDNGEGRISIALIENTESKKRFIFKYFDAGVSPEILYIEGKELIFLGIQFEIIKIDLKNNELKSVIKFSSNFFFEFLETKDFIISIFEMGICVFYKNGTIKWYMELPEILIDWEIVGNDIKLTFFDKKISIQSIETGKIKFISNWLKIKNNNSIFDDLEQQILAEKSYMIKQ